MRKVKALLFFTSLLFLLSATSTFPSTRAYNSLLNAQGCLPVGRNFSPKFSMLHSNHYLTIFSSSGNVTSIPVGKLDECTVSFVSVRGKVSIFVNDVRDGDKVDILLRNLTFLSEYHYLNNGRVRTIILLGCHLWNDYYAVTYGVEEAIRRGLCEQVSLVNGTVLECGILPFVFADIPYENVFRLVDNPNVVRIFLDRRFQTCLNESVPIVKSPAKWAEIERFFGYKIDGKGVKTAILDTGIDKSHPDLDDIDDDPGTFDPKVVAEKCFTDENHTWDGHGHGTHCASIAAGTGEASNYKFVGVAPGAYLLNGKVLTDEGWGWESWIISGIEWAVTQGANVISMSLGTDINGDGTDPLSLAVDWAVDNGVVCTVAAGNAGWGGMFTVGIPAVSRKAITVGATTKADEVAYFSSQGPTADLRIKPDVCAPGVNIIAARARGTSMGTPINEYYTMASGTSMATPHVAGAAALLLQAHPDWSPTMVKSALMGQAVTLNGEHIWRQGAGRIDVSESVNATLLIVEPSSSFGVLGLGDAVSVTLTMINVGGFPVAVNISTITSCEGNLADYVSVNVTSFTIPAHNNVSILLQAGPLDGNACEGWYEGFLIASTSQDYVKAPYFFGALSTLTTYLFDIDNKTPVNAMVLAASYPDLSYVSFSSDGNGAKFYLKSGNYSILTQSTCIQTETCGSYNVDYSRAFMLQKIVSVPKLSRLNVSISLSEAKVSTIPTVDSSGKNLTVHEYVQYLCGGPQTWYDYFFTSEWSIGSMWFGFDLNVSHVTFYSTPFKPPDRLCEALGYYASNDVFSEVYLTPFKFWNVSSLPDVISYQEADLAKYYVFYDVPETYPENGLNSMNAFWFTWDYLGPIQVWGWDVHSVYAGINATYYLAPEVATYWGLYMPTYRGWPDYTVGPLQEWTIGRHYPYPQMPLEKGETGTRVLGRFSFAPYQPGLSLNVSSSGSTFSVNLTGDIWRGLSWPHWDCYMLSPLRGPISPYPHFYATYRVYVNQMLFDEGKLNGREGYGGEPYVHYPPYYFDVDWRGICKAWNITGGRVTLMVNMPSLAFLSMNSSLKMSFLLGQSDSTPPTIKGISHPLNYTVGGKIRVALEAEDHGSGIKEMSLLYSFDRVNWFEAEREGGGVFEFQAQRKDAVAVRIIVEDYAGNRLEYETYPLAVCSDLQLKMEGGLSNPGEPLHGSLATLEGNPMKGFAVLVSNGQYSRYVQSNNFSYEAPQKIGETAQIRAEFHGSNMFSSTSNQAAVTSTALNVDAAIASSKFINTNDTVTVYVHMVYAHDGSPVSGGLAGIEGVAYAETNSSGWARVEVARSWPATYWFRAIGVRDSYGRITRCGITQNLTITWTHIIIDDKHVSDDRADVGSLQYVAFHASWAHNNSDVVRGVIYVNGSAYTTNSTGWVAFSVSSRTVGRQLWTITGVSCSGITKYEKAVADPYIVWDKVIFTLSVVDGRINTGDSAQIDVVGRYAYDGTAFQGTYALNDTLTKTSVGKWDFAVASMTDTEYGLTVFESNAVDVIWDRIKTIWYGVSDDRCNVGSTQQVRVKLVLEYDSTPLGLGDTVYINETLASYDPTGGWFYINHSQSVVGRKVFAVSSAFQASYGIKAFLETQTPPSIIWDRVDVTLSVPR